MHASQENPGDALAAHAEQCPPCSGIYRLYRGLLLLHIGMAAGAATVQSEVLAHARGEYGAHTQAADRVDWEVVPDAILAYRRFRTLFAAATSLAGGALDDVTAPSASGRHSPAMRR